MKVVLLLALVFATVLAAPEQKGLKFRNLYKDVLPGVKPKAPIGGRIINGQIAEPHSIPYQVFLTVYSLFGGWYCGGSLISTNFILTAGHCGADGTDSEIVLGAQKPLENEDSQLLATSSEIIVHSKFNIDTISYDIAVFKLLKSVILNNVISIVRLPTLADVSNTYEGSVGRVSGWGLTVGGGNELSEQLRWVENPIISNKECDSVFGIVEDYQVCISGEGGRGSCNGDSGGPLTVNGTQVGVVSYGATGCPTGLPSAFTRTTSFLDWIGENTDVEIK